MSKDPDALLDMAAIAAELGVGYATIRKYRSAGRLPEPDELPVPDRPRWRRATILAWQASRPGQGRRPARDEGQSNS